MNRINRTVSTESSKDNLDEIKNIVKEWKRHSGIPEDEHISYHIVDNVLYVITKRPGYLIGQRGYLIKGYASILKEYDIESINVFEENRFTEV